MTDWLEVQGSFVAYGLKDRSTFVRRDLLIAVVVDDETRNVFNDAADWGNVPFANL